MGTLVLQSHDHLPRHQFLQSSNPNPGSNSFRPHRRRKSPTVDRRVSSPDNPQLSPTKNLVMGQVRILKRGEDITRLNLNPTKLPGSDLVLSSTNWIGPDPEAVHRHVRISDLYAGAACLPSPPPSSLPFPTALVRRVI